MERASQTPPLLLTPSRAATFLTLSKLQQWLRPYQLASPNHDINICSLGFWELKTTSHDLITGCLLVIVMHWAHMVPFSDDVTLPFTCATYISFEDWKKGNSYGSASSKVKSCWKLQEAMAS